MPFAWLHNPTTMGPQASVAPTKVTTLPQGYFIYCLCTQCFHWCLCLAHGEPVSGVSTLFKCSLQMHLSRRPFLWQCGTGFLIPLRNPIYTDWHFVAWSSFVGSAILSGPLASLSFSSAQGMCVNLCINKPAGTHSSALCSTHTRKVHFLGLGK